jgi:4-hydroxy-2-oxoheptanedioate aldolase
MESTLRQRILDGDTTLGCWLTLGSSLTAESVGRAGFDWALVDLEHGAGTESEAVGQIRTLLGTLAAPLVRVESSARQRAGRVLDFGAAGVMFPRIENADEARRVAAALRYPPEGIRGLASGTPAAGLGAHFDRYREWAASGIVGIVQVETAPILDCLDDVAAIDGIDVLFVGPKDLSMALGVFGESDHPSYVEALEAVVAACRKHGKSAGILLGQADEFATYHGMGFRFLGCGADGVFVSAGAAQTIAALQEAVKQVDKANR